MQERTDLMHHACVCLCSRLLAQERIWEKLGPCSTLQQVQLSDDLEVFIQHACSLHAGMLQVLQVHILKATPEHIMHGIYMLHARQYACIVQDVFMLAE